MVKHQSSKDGELQTKPRWGLRTSTGSVTFGTWKRAPCSRWEHFRGPWLKTGAWRWLKFSIEHGWIYWSGIRGKNSQESPSWLVVTGTWMDDFYAFIECHHPISRTPSLFSSRGGSPTNQLYVYGKTTSYMFMVKTHGLPVSIFLQPIRYDFSKTSFSVEVLMADGSMAKPAR